MTRFQCLQVAGLLLLGGGSVLLVILVAYKRRLRELGIENRVSRRAPVERKVIREINEPNLRAHVRQWMDARDQVTELVALIPAAAAWLSVRTPNWNVLTPFGGLDVPSAPAFRVTTSDLMYARLYLNDEAWLAIETLSHAFGEAVFLEVRPGQFVVRVREPAAAVPKTEQFLEQALRLAARASSLVGGSPVGGVHGQVGACARCGKPVPPVRQLLCPVCRTPHHRDCWGDNGGCASFGCNTAASSN